LRFNQSGVQVVMVSFLSYRGSRPDHFYGVTDGWSPPRIRAGKPPPSLFPVLTRENQLDGTNSGLRGDLSM